MDEIYMIQYKHDIENMDYPDSNFVPVRGDHLHELVLLYEQSSPLGDRDISVDWKRVRDLYARRDTITSGDFMKTIQRHFSPTRHEVIDECIQSLKFGDKSAWLKSELNGRDYCISYLEGLKNPLLDNK